MAHADTAEAIAAPGDRLRRALGVRPRNPGKSYLFYRHSLWVRVAHWLNALIILIMLMSGAQIFNATPALYWGKSADFAQPVLAMNAVGTQTDFHGQTTIGSWTFNTDGWFGASADANGIKQVRGFPAWATLPGPSPNLALGRLWHFAFAWLLVINGLAYIAYAIASGHVRRDLLPRLADLKRLPREVLTHAQLRFHRGEDAKHYNPLQKLTYFAVVFVLGPLIVLTGLTMSPTMDSAFPFLLWVFDGRQSARTIHFVVAFLFVAFILMHLIMVVLSGTWNNIRSMITGRYAIEREETHG